MYFYSELIWNSSDQIIYQFNFKVWSLNYGKVIICIESYIITTTKQVSKLLGWKNLQRHLLGKSLTNKFTQTWELKKDILSPDETEKSPLPEFLSIEINH